MSKSVGGAMSSFIEFSDVQKIYSNGQIETVALHEMSFCIEKSEFCVVVGPSGAGKTTLLNLLGGMDTCTNGTIKVDQEEISRYSADRLTLYRRYDVGFVFQFYNLIQNLTAKENVELATELCKNPLPAEQVLCMVGLEHRMNNFPSQLSGGEQQRVSIARALAKNPKLLLCDEPTGALDDMTGKQVLSMLQKTSRQEGMTVVLITHNSAITQMAERIISVKNGTVGKVTMNKTPKNPEEIEW